MSSCFLPSDQACHQTLRHRTATLGCEALQARGLTVQQQNCTTGPNATSFKARPTHARRSTQQRGFMSAITTQLTKIHRTARSGHKPQTHLSKMHSLGTKATFQFNIAFSFKLQCIGAVWFRFRSRYLIAIATQTICIACYSAQKRSAMFQQAAGKKP